MTTAALLLPEDLIALRAALAAEQLARREAEARASGAEAMVAHLKLMIAKLRHERFGASSERGRKLLDQLELQLEELETTAAEDEAVLDPGGQPERDGEPAHARIRRKPVRGPLPVHLPRERMVNRGIRPRILIFDYKRDYSSADFVGSTGARIVRPHKLPLNLFDTTGLMDSMVPWLDRFRFFADVLDKIYSGIGPVQRDKLKRAVRSAYEAQTGTSAPTIYDVHAAYALLLDGKSDSPMAIIDDLVDMQIFEPDPSKCVPFDTFLDGVVVVSLDALGQDDRSKNMLVAVMLNMFYENMLRTVKRPFLGDKPQLRAIDSYLLVDEADNIMRYEFDVLRKLLLQGREFGCGVILASQYLRHFKVNATDYREPLLTWFVHKVPNVTPAELASLGLASSAAETAERVKSLGNHQCLYKSFDSPGQIIRGLPFYELTAHQTGDV